MYPTLPYIMTLQSTGLAELKTTTSKSGNCGCTGNSASVEMEESIKERIAKHPCYSEEAHHHYARMHVAVAPACNIQCRY